MTSLRRFRLFAGLMAGVILVSGCGWIWGSSPDGEPRAETERKPLISPGESDTQGGESTQTAQTTPSSEKTQQTRDPRRARQLAYEAQQAYQNGNKQVALEKFRQAAQLDPSNPDIQYNLATLYFRNQNYAQARNYYRRSVEADPESSSAHYYLARSYQELGNTTRARRHYQRVLELDPANQRAQRQLNALPEQSSGTEMAEVESDGDEGERILPEEPASKEQVNPEKASQLAAQGREAFQQGDLERAAELFTRAVQHDPSNVDVRFNLGTVHFQQGDYEQARNHYQKVINMQPDDVAGHYYLGLTYQRLDRTSRARQQYKRVLRLNPDHSRAQTRLNQLGS